MTWTEAWIMHEERRLEPMTHAGVDSFKKELPWMPDGEKDRVIPAIVALFERTYWQRIWILQEMILPPDAIVMEHSLCHGRPSQEQ